MVPDHSGQQDSAFEPRFSATRSGWIALVWVVAVALLTLDPIQVYLDYFAERDPRFRWLLLAMLASLAAGSLVYARVRLKGVWKWEPRAAFALAAICALGWEPLGTAVGVWMAVACFAAGAAALDRLGIQREGNAADLALNLGAGVGALALLMIPLGLAGLYSPWLFVALLLLVTVAFRRQVLRLWRTLAEIDSIWRRLPEVRSRLVGVAAPLVFVLLVIFVVNAVTPAIQKDPMAYHLPAVKHYVASGKLEPVPALDLAPGRRTLFTIGHSTSYSYYPQSYEETLAFAMALAGMPGVRMFTLIYYLIALLAVLAIGKAAGLTRFERLVGGVGALSLPFAHWTGANIKNDAAMACFQLLALYLCIRGRDARDDNRLLYLAAAFLGLSFGVKHVAIFGGIPIGLLLLDALRRRPRFVRNALVIGVVFAACGTFWHARAFVLKGNPIYPAGARHAVRQYRATDLTVQSRWKAYLTFPWILHFDGYKVIKLPMPTPSGFFMAFLAIAWLLTRRRMRSSVTYVFLVYLTLYYIYWVWVWGVIRYGLAPLLIVALLTGGRAAALWARSGPRQQILLETAALLGMVLAVPPILVGEINPQQIRYLTGQIDLDGYLRAANRFYPSMKELDRLLRDDELAVSVENCNTAYVRNPAQVRCVEFMEETKDEVLVVVADLVRDVDARYLLLRSRNREWYEGVIAELQLEQVYVDDYFVIYSRNRP